MRCPELVALKREKFERPDPRFFRKTGDLMPDRPILHCVLSVLRAITQSPNFIGMRTPQSNRS